MVFSGEEEIGRERAQIAQHGAEQTTRPNVEVNDGRGQATLQTGGGETES